MPAGHGRAAGGQPDNTGKTLKISDPQAQFFVLKDNVALRGSDITNPQAVDRHDGQPDVQFGFNSTGNTAFQDVTGQIAHRGQQVQRSGRRSTSTSRSRSTRSC